MSHSRPRATLNEVQRVHLAVAEFDSAALSRFIAATNDATAPITALDWLAAATRATGLAEQLSVVAELADTAAGAQVWRFAAARVRDTAARFELWAELAEVGARAHDAA